MDPFKRSRKIFSPLPRNDSLMLSFSSVPGAGRWFKTGPGDSVRRLGLSKTGGISCDNNGAPQSSQESSNGEFSNVQRGHWKNASPLFCEATFPELWLEVPHTSDCGRGLLLCARKGIGVRKGTEDDCGARLVALDIAALRTRANGGLIPHAKHGASGVCSAAVCGSKFDGTGFEKLHMGHIHVAVLVDGGSGVGR